MQKNKIMLSMSFILLISMFVFTIYLDTETTITGKVTEEIDDYDFSDFAITDPNGVIDQDDIDCENKCQSRSFDEGRFFDRTCYCMNYPYEYDCNSETCNDLCPTRGRCNTEDECICDGEVEQFYCRDYYTDQGEKGTIIYSNRREEFITKNPNSCSEGKLNYYNCIINNYYEAISPDAKDLSNTIKEQLEKIMLKQENQNCNLMNCGASQKGTCSGGECICVYNVEKDLLEEALINFLMNPNLNIDKDDLLLLLKAYYRLETLDTGEINQIQNSISNIKNQLNSPNQPRINYKILY